MFDIEDIQKKIHYQFEDSAWLHLAFTHSSYANENDTASNEKLEFLGDSVLNFVIADYLFRRGAKNEGELSVTRSRIVSEPPLAEAVTRMDIIGHLICGVGENKNNPDKSDAVKADLFEAVTAAIYLDSGDVVAAEKFILRHLDFIIQRETPQNAVVKFNLPDRQVDNNSDRYRFAADKHRGQDAKPQRGRSARTDKSDKSGKAAAVSAAPRPAKEGRRSGLFSRLAPAKAASAAPVTAAQTIPDTVPPTPKELKKLQKLLQKEEKEQKKQQKSTEPAVKPSAIKAFAAKAFAPKSLATKSPAAKLPATKLSAQKSAPRKAAKTPESSEAQDAHSEGKEDFKSKLQNHLQRGKLGKADYRLIEQSGSAHEPFFKVALYIDGKLSGEGEGSRKRDAERLAAMEACRTLNLK